MPQSSADLAKSFGGAPTTADLAAQFGGTPEKPAAAPAAPSKPAERTWLDDAGDAIVGLWNKQPIHPIDMVQGAAQAIRDPKGTIGGILDAQGKPLDLAGESFKRGDYVAGVTHAFNYLLPIIGPQISDAQERTRKGEQSMAGLAGESVGIGLQVAMPEALRRAPVKVPVTPKVTNPNPAEASAVAFGQRSGIPIDAGTATGSKVVKGTQYVADRSIGGALVAEPARAAQEAALTRTSGQLASRAHPTAVAPYQAGEAIQTALEARVKTYGQQANQAYDALRTIEADPKNTTNVRMAIDVKDAAGNVKKQQVTVPMQMPVDLKAVKAQLRPLRDRMMRQMPVAQQRADPALHAIQNILDSPDYLPVSMVDMDLSAIKALSRTDGPVRDVSQGLAATAVRTLNAAVDSAVAKGGTAATDALKAGRAATTAKHGVADLVKVLRDEPVQAFQQATWANDSGIDRLNAIAKQAPTAMRQIGRAYLDDLFSKATVEGGFSRGAGLQAQWQKLGPQTKAALFNKALVKDLDDFFLLAKKIGESPNPSGTGHIVSLGAQGAALVTNPLTGVALQLTGAALSKLLHSKTGVRLLTRGLQVPIGSKAAGASVVSSLTALAKQEGVTLRPVTADAEPSGR